MKLNVSRFGGGKWVGTRQAFVRQEYLFGIPSVQHLLDFSRQFLSRVSFFGVSAAT
jgi:hypothetical protein